MNEIPFYEVVEVLQTADSVSLGVSGNRGVVIGLSAGESEEVFAVLIGDRTYMLGRSSLMQTGERADPASIYAGDVVRVTPERYPDDER
ncbi:hypothetical protein [Streptomyces sp. SBT349]|uniref:hypothetical protein n=1 Tax=Streptomyces sp. SBT349 TaxID=1580539 RepID=UPI000B0A9B54|nr:hypothetical protein [Streptomyces sp. SBT349]